MITHTAEELLNILDTAFRHGQPLAAWSLPGQQEIRACVQSANELHPSGNFDRKGFVFEPFHQGHPGVFIVADKEYKAAPDFPITGDKPAAELPGEVSDGHIALVQKAIEVLKKGDLEKVVLSRKISLTKQGGSPFQVFVRLLSRYPGAFRYLWHHPAVGTWLGATPETLLSVKNGEMHTMSLAGTQPFRGTTEVEWGEKEREEQAMVTRSVLGQIGPLAVDIKTGITQTVKAGNLLHLLTPITAKLPSGTTGLNKVISVLHPTPAVCGLPREKAREFILEHEGYDRKYYTGYLGPVDPEKGTDLFVNLRCMEVRGEEYSIYVGGGITRDSDPEAEWQETVNKSETMRSVL